MIAQGLANGTTSLTTRENIIEWTRIATNDPPEQMVQNAWRQSQYSWFSPASAAEPAIVHAEEAEPAVSEDIEVEEESEDKERENANSTVVQFIQ
jgi:hypothetical protein